MTTAPSSDRSASRPSAFPDLPADPDVLPEIPGGWQVQVADLGGTPLRLQRPVSPDLFLDDERVAEENERNDYMPYWAFLWPAAHSMATAVYHAAEWPSGSEVLELGAGLGVVGLASMLRGDRVVFSDYDETALHVCRLNARLNGLADPELMKIDWRDPPERHFPVIIGCEVTYDAATHAALLELFDKMLAPDGVIWIGDPGRYQGARFHAAAAERGWQIDITNEAGKRIDEPSTEGFQILRMRREQSVGHV